MKFKNSSILLFLFFSSMMSSLASGFDLTDGLGLADDSAFEGDWSFAIEKWSIDNNEEGVKSVSISVAYQIPEVSRIILMVSKGNYGLKGPNLDSKYIQDPKEGTVTFDFEDPSDDYLYWISLWIGSNREISPSGVLGPAIIIDFSPSIINPNR